MNVSERYKVHAKAAGVGEQAAATLCLAEAVASVAEAIQDLSMNVRKLGIEDASECEVAIEVLSPEIKQGFDKLKDGFDKMGDE
jgi:cell pole-organizing protein PopZ